MTHNTKVDGGSLCSHLDDLLFPFLYNILVLGSGKRIFTAIMLRIINFVSRSIVWPLSDDDKIFDVVKGIFIIRYSEVGKARHDRDRKDGHEPSYRYKTTRTTARRCVYWTWN